MRQLAHRTIVALVFALALIVPGHAQEIETNADYAILMDAETGLVLFEKNADELMAPASMSKLMTMLMLFERLKDETVSKDDTFFISENAWRRGGAASGGSTMFAEVNSWVRVEDLIRGVIVQSGNDASIAIAEALGGTEEEFGRMMTAKAREIGLERSVFTNSTGLPDPNHLTTARELALLARHIIREYPEYYRYYAERSFTWNNISQNNRNPLIYQFPGADGLKTGHTSVSGYGLVGSAERDGQRLIMVINGLGSERERAQEAVRLMSVGFQNFRRFDLFEAGTVVGKAEVFGGRVAEVPLVVREDVRAMLHRNARRNMRVAIKYSGPLKAPVAQGTEVARLVVSAPGFPGLDLPLYADADVPSASLMQRLGMGINHLIFGAMNESE